jgi:hypothetical protein
MVSPLRRIGRAAILIAAALAALLLWQTVAAQPASAHGKDLDIAVTPLIPDPDQPLLRLYRVHVVFVNDREPVEGATVLLTAQRDDGTSSLPARELTEVDGGHGLYVGVIDFFRFGVWVMDLSVEAELGQGEGSVTFTNDIRPGALSPDREAALRDEAERVIRLQLSFGFGWWPDVVNIGVRIIHSIAGLTYFLVTGLVLMLAWFGIPSRRPDFPRWLDRLFLPAAAASLALLLGAGLYSAAFDAPITSPGIYDISTMRRIPYGEAYLAAFLVKVALFLVLAVLAVRIHRALREWNANQETIGDGAAVSVLRRETFLNAAVGVAVIADVAVLIYLHYISHLGVFLPES